MFGGRSQGSAPAPGFCVGIGGLMRKSPACVKEGGKSYRNNETEEIFRLQAMAGDASKPCH